MATLSTESGSGFDHILKNTEFENDQQLKAIKAEQERIQTYQSQLKEKRSQIVHLEKSITDLDEHAKKLHKQFVINRDNCESLKHTAIVLADHEEALKTKLIATEKDVESERHQQSEALSKYDKIWKSYKTKYESTEKAQDLMRTEMELNNLLEKNAALETQISQTKEAILSLKQQDDDGLSLVSMVLKIAKLKVETEQVRRLTSTENKQTAQLEEEIKILHEDIKRAEKEKEQREQQLNKETDMEVDNNPSAPVISTETSQPPSNTSPTTTPGRLVTATKTLSSVFQLKVPVTTPLVTGQTSTPARYRLEIPKLSMPPRATIRSQVSEPMANTSSLLQSPAITVPTSRPRSNFQLPNLAVSTPPAKKVVTMPAIPQLHTPRSQSLPFSVQPTSQQPSNSIIKPTPQISLPILHHHKSSSSTPILANQSLSLTSQALSSSVTTTSSPATDSTMQTKAAISSQSVVGDLSQQPETQDNNTGTNVLGTNQQFPVKSSREQLNEYQFIQSNEQDCNNAAESVVESQEYGAQGSFDTAPFSTGSLYDYSTEYGSMGEDGQVNANNEGQVELHEDDGGQLFYGMEAHLGEQGSQPDMSAGDMFMSGFDFGQGTPSGHGPGSGDTGGGFSLFSTGVMDTTKPTGTPDFSFSFGGDDSETTGSSLFF